MLLHYLEKLKIQIFCRYSTIIPDMEENANKLHFKCTDFNSSARVTVRCLYLCVFVTILSSSLNIMLIIDKHCSDICCDEFPMPQIDSKSKQIKNSDMENFICNQYDKNATCLHFLPYLLNICRKFEFLISQGNIPKVRWTISCDFCSKFHTLSSSAKI